MSTPWTGATPYRSTTPTVYGGALGELQAGTGWTPTGSLTPQTVSGGQVTGTAGNTATATPTAAGAATYPNVLSFTQYAQTAAGQQEQQDALAAAGYRIDPATGKAVPISFTDNLTRTGSLTPTNATTGQTAGSAATATPQAAGAYPTYSSTGAPADWPWALSMPNEATMSPEGFARSGGAFMDMPEYMKPWAELTGVGTGGFSVAGYAPQPSGELSGPGTYEQWYAQNAGQLGQPGPTSGWWNSTSGQYTAPTSSEQWYGSTQPMYTAPGASTTWNNQTTSQFQTSGDMENWYDQNSFRYGLPTALDGYARTLEQGPGAVGDYLDANMSGFTGPNALSTWLSQNGADLVGPSDMAAWFQQNQSRFGEPSALSAWAGQNQGAMTGPSSMQEWFGQNADRFGTDAAADWWAQNQDAFSPAGSAEEYWQNTQNEFAAPGSMEQFWSGVAGRLGQGPEVSNRAEEQYQAFGQNRPDVGLDAGLDPYYDRAEEKTLSALNQQLGARGAYGSSVGLGMLGGASADLRAEQANREADYRLRALGEQRNWEELAGGLARSADVSSRSVADADLQRTLGFGNMAMDAQTGGLNRLLGAAGVASDAQRLGLSRLLGAAGMATDVGRLGLDRLLGAGGLAMDADTADYRRTALGADVADRMSTQDLARMQAEGQFAADASEQNRLRTALGGALAGQAAGLNLEGLIAGGQLAGDVSQADLARDTLNANVATNQSQLGLDYLNSYADAANMSQDAGLSRLLAGTDAARYADASQLGRLTAGTDAAYRAATTNTDLLRAGTEASLAADRMDLARDELGGGLAYDAQRAEQDRLQQEFNNRFSVFNTLSGLAGSTYDSIFGTDLDLMGSAIGAPLAGATNTANTMNANQQQALSIIPQFLSMFFGGLGGGAAGAAGAGATQSPSPWAAPQYMPGSYTGASW